MRLFDLFSPEHRSLSRATFHVVLRSIMLPRWYCMLCCRNNCTWLSKIGSEVSTDILLIWS